LTIRSAAQLMDSDPDFKQKIYDLEVRILQDVPMSEEFTPPPYEQWVKRFDSPNFIPETWMVGLDGATYVGLSRLMGDDVRQDKLWTGLTGVRREHRRHGLATALKIAGIQVARERGVTEIETDNEENNPMYQLNLQLGFQPAPAWLEYGLKLDGAAE
jgi:GNAT superfamily N-acetyltransferase